MPCLSVTNQEKHAFFILLAHHDDGFCHGLLRSYDPPYNTQSAFTHYDDKLEHSQWLSMIYPRMVLLRELLSDDGSIWVSLDDREAHYFKVMMDEIFGRENYLGDLIWKKRKGGGNDSHFFASDHEYILSYVKSSNKKYHPMKWRVSQTQE